MAKGSMFLKVVGIVMIVCGAIGVLGGLVVGLFSAIGSLFVAAAGGNPILLILQALFQIVASVLTLVCGILALKNNNDPSKAQTCMTWGIIVAVCTLVSYIILPLLVSGGIAWLGAICGLVLPGLIIYGAILNKQ